MTAVAVAKLYPATYLVDTLPAYEPTYPSTSALSAIGGLVVLAIIAKRGLELVLPKLVRSESAPSRAPAAENSAPASASYGSTSTTSPSTDSATTSPSPSTAPASSSSSASPLTLLPYLLSALTFSLGLTVSGMISPLKVIGFLRLPPPLATWDPSLACVVAAGVVPNMVHWLTLRERKPLFGWEKWQVPTRKDLDWRLVAGALAFGAGWGLAGVCPGPALATGGQLVVDAARGVDVSMGAQGWGAYFGNMLLGMAAARFV